MVELANSGVTCCPSALFLTFFSYPSTDTWVGVLLTDKRSPSLPTAAAYLPNSEALHYVPTLINLCWLFILPSHGQP